MTLPKKYGEFFCPHCDAVFFTNRQLQGHIGGKHRRFKIEKLVCKKCGCKLIKDKNWAKWAYKKGNMICSKCKNKENLVRYYKKKETKNDD